MDQGTIERPPDGLRALYDGDFSDAPFTVDDVLAAGRTRQVRRRATVAGSSAAVAVAVGLVAILSTGVLGGRTHTLVPATPTTSGAPTPGFRVGCSPVPSACQ
jgi:hypothetical protein